MHYGICVHCNEINCKLMATMQTEISSVNNPDNKMELNSTETDSFFQNSSSIDITDGPFQISGANSTFEEEYININKTGNKSGGITCCVPHCFNNSKRNKELSFYVIPKDKTLRKVWLSKISRKDFIPTKSHRVCSSHFEGGKKTYTNNVFFFFFSIMTQIYKKTRT